MNLIFQAFSSSVLFAVLCCGLVIVTFLTLVMAWQRLYQQSRQRFGLVAFANCLAAFCLLLLMAQWLIPKNIPQFHLLTPNWQNALLEPIKKGDSIFLLNNAVPENRNHPLFSQHKILTLESIDELNFFINKQPSLAKLAVYGEGLYERQWRKVANAQVTFYPNPKTIGITEPQWNSTVLLGEPIKFSGRLQALADKQYLVSIYDLSGEVLFNQQQPSGSLINATWQAKTIGPLNYKLTITDVEQPEVILSEETIAVNVTQAQPINVLIMQSSPNFETKHLVNWLTAQQSKTLTVSKISQEKWQAKAVNFSKEQQNSWQMLELDKSEADYETLFSQQVSQKFNLVILQGEIYSQMPERLKSQLFSRIEAGQNLLVLPDLSLIKYLDSSPNDPLHHLSLSLANNTHQQLDTTKSFQTIQWRGNVIEHALPLSAFSLKAKETHQSEIVISNHQNQAQVRAIIQGWGRLAVSLIKQSYQWKINGFTQSYSQFWQHVLKHVINRQNQFRWLLPSYINDENLFTAKQLCFVQSSNNEHKNKVIKGKVSSKDSTIAFLFNQSIEQHGKYCAQIPQVMNESGGWLKVSLDSLESSAEVVSVFVYQYGNNNWFTEKEKLKQLTSRQMGKQELTTLVNSEINDQNLPLWLTWLLLFLSSLYLWLEKKLY